MAWLKRIQSKAELTGFTVIEIVITLAISITLVLLGTIQLETYEDKLILDSTAKEIKSSIEQAARIASLREEATIIRYFPNTKKISINGLSYSRDIEIDSHIDIYNLSYLRISDTGSMPPHMISITNHKNKKKVKLQMTWGRAIDSE